MGKIMDKLAILLNFLIDIISLGLTYNLRKRKQKKEEKDNAKKKQDELQKEQEELLKDGRKGA